MTNWLLVECCSVGQTVCRSGGGRGSPPVNAVVVSMHKETSVSIAIINEGLLVTPVNVGREKPNHLSALSQPLGR